MARASAVVIVIMLIFALVVVVIAFSSRSGGKRPSQPKDGCGLRVVKAPQITGGTSAYSGKWPWMVYLGNCGGTLISPTWVLTAGHCVDQTPTQEVSVGTFNLAVDELERQRFRVKRIVIHPTYSRPTLTDDLALIELSRPVPLNDYRRPICLPSSNQATTNRPLYAAGWGETLSGTQPTLLQDIEIREIDPCDSFRINKAKQLCARQPNANRGICFGDSGGPLMLEENNRWIIVGISSFATRPCFNGSGGFTRVSAYLEWIKQTAGL